MTDMMKAVEKLMDMQGIKKATLAEGIGKSRSTINGWFNRGLEPKTAESVKIAQFLNTTVEQLVSGDISLDPAEMYLKKTPGLRSLVIKLGLHPELVAPVDGYLTGYMDSHGYSDEADKKESQNVG